ncbi:MAG TPA: DUF1697 domain-containing protein [Caulobacteraceae bacterium]|nr:DUF1697 domain-containing protein [Caulobacteraceae bacterium]
MSVVIALLRAVNVGGRSLRMVELVSLARDLGFAQPRTFAQSGNLVFETKDAPDADLERRLEAEAEVRFGFAIDFVVRSAAEWRALIANNPFLDTARDDPSHLLVMPLRAAPPTDALDALRTAIKGREEVALTGRDAYLVYPNGIGRSKLTIQVIERHLRTRGTARNWNTALKLAAMAAG